MALHKDLHAPISLCSGETMDMLRVWETKDTIIELPFSNQSKQLSFRSTPPPPPCPTPSPLPPPVQIFFKSPEEKKLKKPEVPKQQWGVSRPVIEETPVTREVSESLDTIALMPQSIFGSCSLGLLHRVCWGEEKHWSRLRAHPRGPLHSKLGFLKRYIINVSAKLV